MELEWKKKRKKIAEIFNKFFSWAKRKSGAQGETQLQSTLVSLGGSPARVKKKEQQSSSRWNFHLILIFPTLLSSRFHTLCRTTRVNLPVVPLLLTRAISRYYDPL